MGDNLLNIALHSLKAFPCESRKVYLNVGLDCLFSFPAEGLLPGSYQEALSPGRFIF